jgi:hypothetical protein
VLPLQAVLPAAAPQPPKNNNNSGPVMMLYVMINNSQRNTEANKHKKGGRTKKHIQLRKACQNAGCHSSHYLSAIAGIRRKAASTRLKDNNRDQISLQYSFLCVFSPFLYHRASFSSLVFKFSIDDDLFILLFI